MANIESCLLLFPDEFRSVALGVFPFDYLLRVEEFSSGSRFNHFSHQIPRHLQKSHSDSAMAPNIGCGAGGAGFTFKTNGVFKESQRLRLLSQ